MCGIAGYVHFDGAPASEETLRAMADRLAHRGPDGDGVLVRKNVGLAHRRLSIIDPSAGAQPMGNEDGTVWVTFNGEIYNHADLREELVRHGHEFRTRCDTEVLVHGFEQWGEKLVDRLLGMFAFAILDERDHTLFLARDRLGIKPLCYLASSKQFAFSSELSALDGLDKPPHRIDRESLALYLRHGCIPWPRTIFRDVFKLPPGHFIKVGPDCGVERPVRYWKLSMTPDEAVDENEWVERIEEGLRDSVRARLMSDVPFGAFLSGGVDSSLVVALMSESMGEPVKTFSMGFDSAGFSELEYARKVATKFGTEHHEGVVKPDAVELLPAIVRHHGEPFGDSSAIATHLVARLASPHVKMVLTGDGGDETFAGYSWYRDTTATFSGFAGSIRSRLEFVIGDKADAMKTSAEALSVFPTSVRKALLGFDARPDDEVGVDSGADLCSRMQLRDLRGYLPNDILAKVDIATMAHGLEARIPFLDHRFVELCGRIPARFKIREENGALRGKSILRKVANRWFDDEFLSRPKQGFAVPLREWFSPNSRADVRARLLDAKSKVLNFLDAGEVRRIVESSADVGNRLWVLLVLDEWLSQHPHVSDS